VYKKYKYFEYPSREARSRLVAERTSVSTVLLSGVEMALLCRQGVAPDKEPNESERETMKRREIQKEGNDQTMHEPLCYSWSCTCASETGAKDSVASLIYVSSLRQ
jgi:hypothetical protein